MAHVASCIVNNVSIRREKSKNWGRLCFRLFFLF